MPDLALIQILINGLQNKEACNIRTLLRSLRSEISPLIDEQRISRIFYGNPKYFVRIPRMSEGSFWRLQSKGAQTKSALKSLAQHTRLQEGENKGRRLTTQPISANKTPNPLLKTSSELEKPSFPKTGAAKIQPLLAWQFEALKAWRDNSQVGIIEAVTGSGKTRVAIEAIAETVKSTDTYSLVIVPTLTLAHQWHHRHINDTSTASTTCQTYNDKHQYQTLTHQQTHKTVQHFKRARARQLSARAHDDHFVYDNVCECR